VNCDKLSQYETILFSVLNIKIIYDYDNEIKVTDMSGASTTRGRRNVYWNVLG
jgi:hypothetical protein